EIAQARWQIRARERLNRIFECAKGPIVAGVNHLETEAEIVSAACPDYVIVKLIHVLWATERNCQPGIKREISRHCHLDAVYRGPSPILQIKRWLRRSGAE